MNIYPILHESVTLPQGNRAALEAELLAAAAAQRLPCYDGMTRDRRIRRYLAAVEAVGLARHGRWATPDQMMSVMEKSGD